jgi:signal peptidase I
MQEDQSENENDSGESKSRKIRRLKQNTVSFFIKLIVAVLAIWIIFHYIFGLFRVNGETMYPSIRDGDLVLYYRLEQEYYQGDAVVYLVNGYGRIARIVAQGGDVVNLNEDGQLLVNGKVQEEEVFFATEKIEGGISYPYTIPEDSYFVLCDFRTNSYDSREYGAISIEDISGKVITIMRRREI